MEYYSIAFDQFINESSEVLVAPLEKFVYVYIYSFELGAAVLDSMDALVLTMLVSASTGALIVLLSEMAIVFVEDVCDFVSTAKSTLASTQARLQSKIARISNVNKATTSRYPIFRRLISLTTIFK